MIKVNKKFILLLIASFIFAIMEGGNLPYYLFYILTFIFLSSLIYISVQKDTLQAEVKFEKNLFSAGDKTEAILRIKCDGPTYCVVVKPKALMDLDSNYIGEAVNITFDENQWIKKDINFIRRGLYDFGDISLDTKDMFGIFHYTKNRQSDFNVKVYPKLYEVKKILSGGKDVFQHMTGINGGSEELFSTRDARKYTRGDNFKRIHWKLSAKCGELYVRNLDIISGDECYLFINMSAENMLLDSDGAIEEALVDFSASFINCMQLNSIKSKLFINLSTSTVFEIETKQNFDALMKFLLDHTSDGNNNFSEYLNSNLRKLNNSNWIGIITLIIDDDLLNTIKNFKINGRKVFVLYSEKTVERAKIEELRKYHVECYDFYDILK